jgi:hypothetical protein
MKFPSRLESQIQLTEVHLKSESGSVVILSERRQRHVELYELRSSVAMISMTGKVRVVAKGRGGVLLELV